MKVYFDNLSGDFCFVLEKDYICNAQVSKIKFN